MMSAAASIDVLFRGAAGSKLDGTRLNPKLWGILLSWSLIVSLIKYVIGIYLFLTGIFLSPLDLSVMACAVLTPHHWQYIEGVTW